MKDKTFKEEAVRLALSSPQSYAQTARELGIKENTLYAWINQYKNETKGNLATDTDLLAENRRLQKENMRLKEEREILKKAAKFFANEQK